MQSGLKVEDLFRAERTGAEIAEGGKVSVESPQPVNVWFRPPASYQVLQTRAEDEPEDTGPGKGSLARQVDRIGHLRISQAYSGDSSDLGAEVDSACVRDVDHGTEEGQLPGKVPVFIPAIEGQRFVEAELVLADGRHPNAHVASVGQVDLGDLLCALGAIAAGDDGFCLIHSKTGPFHIVRKHSAGGSHHLRMFHEKPFSNSEVLRIEIEIVIDEEQDVFVASPGQDSVALACQAQGGLEEGHVGKLVD